MHTVDLADPIATVNETAVSSHPTGSAEVEMSYLTTHDLIWINTALTGDPNAYDYVTLEAVMAGQYQAGDSCNVPVQAAQVLRRLLHYRPFAQGNLATAYIATLTFLNANGYATVSKDEDAAEIILAVANGELDPLPAVQRLGAPAKEALRGVTLRRLITHECNLHVTALKLLADHEGVSE